MGYTLAAVVQRVRETIQLTGHIYDRRKISSLRRRDGVAEGQRIL